jgi:hypothetical protein
VVAGSSPARPTKFLVSNLGKLASAVYHVVEVAFPEVLRSRRRWFAHFRRDATFDGEQRSGRVNLGLWGCLTILAAVMALVFVFCVFVYIGRLENRTPAPLGEKVGAHKAVLAKLRKRESMSQDEVDYAAELISDARSPLAYAIPAALFTMGFFYVVGCLYELHLYGGAPSFRTFVGGIPMFTSMNVAAQLRRVARLKGRLREVSLTVPEPSDELTQAGRT